jgi:hypothetical protein
LFYVTIALSQLEGALPQPHIRNFVKKCWSETALPHIRNHNFSAVRSFNSTTFYIKFYINVAPQPHISISTILIFVSCPKLFKGNFTQQLHICISAIHCARKFGLTNVLFVSVNRAWAILMTSIAPYHYTNEATLLNLHPSYKRAKIQF